MTEFANALTEIVKKDLHTVNLLGISAVTIKVGDVFCAYHYYKHLEDDGMACYYINQVDDWTFSLQPSPINSIEKIVEQIIKQDEIGDNYLEYISFSVLRRDTNYQPNPIGILFKADYTKPKVKILASYTHVTVDDNNKYKFTHEGMGYFMLENISPFRSLSECEADFNMVKLFINSLSMHVKERKKTLNQDIFEYANVKEQTFYNWKKSNPKLVKAITQGYENSTVAPIVDCLSGIGELQYRTWGTSELMTYPDGTLM